MIVTGLTRTAKAASSLLPRHGLRRLLAAAAMALAARAQLAWLWAWVQHGGSEAPRRAGIAACVVGTCIVAWCAVVAIFSLAAVCRGGEPADGRGRRRRLAEAPFMLWALLTPDGRATGWRALAWLLLWLAEPLACLWLALWWLGAAMNLTIHRRGGGA